MRLSFPYWVYRVRSLVPGWKGWRMKAWVWDSERDVCEECGASRHLYRVDTPIGRPPW